MRRTFVGCAFAFVCLFAAASAAQAQDFQKSYQLGAEGTIRIGSMSGDIKISGYDGDAILVSGYKKGTDVDRVKIVDRSSGNGIDIGVEYPKNCRCNVSVDFAVQVPRSIYYRYDQIATMSGDVVLTSVTGDIDAKTMSGDVYVRDARGVVKATTMSGDVEVDLDVIEGNGELTFTTMSGDVEVRLPDSLSADVDLATTSGVISTDFPIEVVRRKYGSGQHARGQLGSGGRSLKARSMSGDVRLKRSAGY